MKRYFIFLLFLVAGFSSLNYRLNSSRTSSVPPNIIIILVDTLRADYLGTYGFKGDFSPSIDRLASESVVFKRCISPAPWTKPSVASLFTSLHPQIHRVIDHEGKFSQNVEAAFKSSVLDDSAWTLAEALKKEGYSTCGVSANRWISERYGFSQGFDNFRSVHKGKRWQNSKKAFNLAREWIEEKGNQKPFFLYLHLMDVHGPYKCEEWNLAERGVNPIFKYGLDKPEKKIDNKIKAYLLRENPWGKSEAGKYASNLRQCYAYGIKRFDRKLNSFIQDLNSLALLDNTILVFTSDHGEELYEHHGWDHGENLYQHQLHVPLFIRFPRAEHKGKVIDEVVSLNDLFPTAVRWAGGRAETSRLHGKDLTGLIKGMSRGREPGVFSSATKNKPRLISYQDKQYKMIWNFPNGSLEFFNVKLDPLDQENISDSREAIVSEYKMKIQTHLEKINQETPLSERIRGLDASEIENLKSLGYLQ